MEIKDKRLFIAILISVAIHLVLILSFSCVPEEEEKAENRGNNSSSSTDKKDREEDLTTVDILPLRETSPDKDCTDWYGGIGITSLVVNNRIIRVHDGYPAKKAGIKPGDILLTDGSVIRGKPGTEVTIEVLREGKEKVFRVKRDKICVDKDE